ncbi:Trypsin [Shimia gijangensis]|uniref:Trypsin n=1 Tax=Shimia gijangensis TaxID=1470563 RepID=A0A1M6BDX0_9RHOB|nr:S1 family peptidase [Shimia gijangensis]SHI46941.1 Trypsin [Shimia gijangensis]
MVHLVKTLVFSLLMAGSALAGDSELRRMDTGDQAQGWEAVGRLELNGSRFCTGALIAHDLVLTAAHCLYDKTTGQRLNVEEIEFRAGWRNGRAEAYRGVRRAVQHPDYQFGAETGPLRVVNDMAILQLHHPIRNTTVTPFEMSGQLRDGSRVGVVSYGKDRADAPSFQQMCSVLGRQSGVYILTCDVDYGSSGSPVFSFENGEARIVSVVSAKATYEQENVALGAVLEGPFEQLMAELDADPQLPAVRRLPSTSDQNRSGAKFVRP